jgi:hypothetical protein
MKIHFIDGISIETAGPLRILHLRDGFYVIGQGNLIPVDNHADGQDTITNMKVADARGRCSWKAGKS